MPKGPALPRLALSVCLVMASATASLVIAAAPASAGCHYRYPPCYTFACSASPGTACEDTIGKLDHVDVAGALAETVTSGPTPETSVYFRFSWDTADGAAPPGRGAETLRVEFLPWATNVEFDDADEDGEPDTESNVTLPAAGGEVTRSFGFEATFDRDRHAHVPFRITIHAGTAQEESLDGVFTFTKEDLEPPSPSVPGPSGPTLLVAVLAAAGLLAAAGAPVLRRKVASLLAARAA